MKTNTVTLTRNKFNLERESKWLINKKSGQFKVKPADNWLLAIKATEKSNFEIQNKNETPRTQEFQKSYDHSRNFIIWLNPQNYYFIRGIKHPNISYYWPNMEKHQ